MSLPSASGLQRAFACPASRHLPKVRKAETSDTKRGTAIHRFLEECGKVGRDAALANVPEEFRSHAEAIDLERTMVGDGISFAAEVALAWDYTTGLGRELGRGLSRQEAYRDAKPTEFVGTLDLIGLTGDAVVIPDIKTGWGYTPPPHINWQLRFAAIAACATYNKSRARTAIVKIHEDGTPWYEWHEYEAFDLAVHAEELAGLGRVIVENHAGPLGAVEGPHCTYCESFAHCPAKAKLAVSLGSGLDSSVLTVALTPETAAKAWDRIKAARLVLDEVESKVREYARETPLLLPDGAVLGPVETSRDELDGEVAFTAIAKTYGPDVAAVAVEKEATKKSVDRAMRKVSEALKAKGEKATLKELNEKALEVIRKAGGLTTKTKVAVKEHHPHH